MNDDEFRFNDASTHEGHLRLNGELIWFCNVSAIMISHICIQCKTNEVKKKCYILLKILMCFKNVGVLSANSFRILGHSFGKN